jgi:6-phosphogluconolactonase
VTAKLQTTQGVFAMSATSYVYVSCPYSGDICIYRMDLGSGALTEIGRQAVGDMVMPLAVSPDRRCLYAATRGEQPEIASFRIDPATGSLAEIGRIQLTDSLPFISIDQRGRYLLAPAFPQGTVRVHPIGPRGQVSERPVMVEHNFPTAHCIKTDPSNRFVLVPVRDGDMLLQRRFDEGTGMLTPNDPPVYRARHNSGPRHFVFHPNHRFVFVIYEKDATVDACGYDIATGKLSLIQTVNLLPADFSGHSKASDIQITPDGRFLYAAERATNTLIAFSVHGDLGKLTEIGRHTTQEVPRAFQIDPRGNFLLCPGERTKSLTVHKIDAATGGLSDVAQYPTGDGACHVEIVDFP